MLGFLTFAKEQNTNVLPAPLSVYNWPAVSGAFRNMLTGRTAFVALGDSNQIFQTSGNDYGFPMALLDYFPAYASSLNSGLDNQALGGGIGYSTQPTSPGAGVVGVSIEFTSANATLESYSLYDGSNTHCTAFGINGATFNSNNGISSGLSSNENTAVPKGFREQIFRADEGFTYQIWNGTYTSAAGGQFSPNIRLDLPSYGNYLSTTNITSQTGSDGIRLSEIVLPADSTRVANWWGARWDSSTGTSTGPYAVYWQRIYDPSVTAGFSYNTLFAVGGNSLYEFAAFVQSAEDNALTLFFQAVRNGLSATDHVCVVIDSGVNDRNETSQPSLGPGAYTDADSPEAYGDNLRAIVERIEEIYDLNSWDKNYLSFISVQTHPISDPDDSELLAYVQAAKDYADTRERLAVLDHRQLANSAYYTANDWYNSGVDPIHLKARGYCGKWALAMADICSKVGSLNPYYPYIANTSVFDGTNDYMSQSVGGNQSGANQATISFWIRPPTQANLGERQILALGSIDDSGVLRPGIGLTLLPEGNGASDGCTIKLYAYTNGSTQPQEWCQAYDINYAIPRDVWTHVYIVLDADGNAGAGRYEFYFNGTRYEDIQEDVTFRPAPGTFTLATGAGLNGIGRWNTQSIASNYINARLAEVFVDQAVWEPATYLSEFIDSQGYPRELGPTGAFPTGTRPLIALNNWFGSYGTNAGDGGNFTITGALTIARHPQATL